MPTYTQCPVEIHDLAAEVRDQHHGDLDEAEVTIGLLFAWPNEREEHALKHHGCPAAGLCKINALRDRVQGAPDATIVLDGKRWETLSETQRRALLDHELYHLEVRRDEDDQIVGDDHGRPKLRMRLHDREMGVFDAIVRRYGAEGSIDAAHVASVAEFHGQLLMAWAKEAKEDAA